jgi:hypothetical protein
LFPPVPTRVPTERTDATLAVAGLVVIHRDATPYDDLVNGSGRPALVASAVAGVSTLGLVWTRRFDASRVGAVVVVAAVVAGWALAQNPALLAGLTVEEAGASHDTLVAVIVAVVVGGAILSLAGRALRALVAGPAGPPDRRAWRQVLARHPRQYASRADGTGGGTPADRALRIPQRRRGGLGSRDRRSMPPGLRRHRLRSGGSARGSSTGRIALHLAISSAYLPIAVCDFRSATRA